MSVQDFIASGLIEVYVLGAANETEQREVELMVSRHPEVKAALEQAREDLESFVSVQGTEPRPEMRDRILQAVENQDNAEEKGRIIPLNNGRTGFAFSRTAAAAVIVLLLGSVAFNLYLFSDIRKAHDEVNLVSAQVKNLRDSVKTTAEQKQALQARFDTMSASFRNSMDAMRALENPATIVMKSVKNDVPQAQAVVYWCSNTRLVCIDPKTLPVQTETGKDYQLWAIVDGKPVSVGVFSNGTDSELKMMRVVPQAEAFAVTLEKKGGVASPEGPMYVMAKI
ncbi:MAG: hypothetical protein FD123_3757 [Bacteroidetes bacterium]|nr:MAG: hypothetical protein FD123_3757 [Bacteroidota bacterium]